MRNALLALVLLGAGLLGFFVLLPLIGVLFVIVLVLVVAVVGFVLAAPFLARLPWFRDRIHVRRYGPGTSMHFGRRDPFGGSEEPAPPRSRLDHGDVIDVEGREIPSEDEKQG